ncbi:MAG: phospho-N-acetylmuramoyl-pentapeptide-transferase, partial [Cyanobacteria bacterium P01_H01_bin.119]
MKGIAVDAKFLAAKSVGLSGNALLWIVGAGLSLLAIGLDLAAGREFGSVPSLTLPFVVAAIVTGLIGLWAVPALRRLKTGQFIREDGPQAHLKKAGTPTMGGSFFIPVAIAIALIFTGFSPITLAVSALTLSYAAIGWLDDWQVLRRRSNKGISPRAKLVLQIGLAIMFCLWALTTQPT